MLGLARDAGVPGVPPAAQIKKPRLTVAILILYLPEVGNQAAALSCFSGSATWSSTLNW